MQLSIKVDLRSVERSLAGMRNQIPFAMALTLTRVAQAVQRDMPAELERRLDRPTPFTKAGFFIRPARKDRLVAEVGIKPTTYAYLRKQIEGGTYAPEKSRLKLPSQVQLNQFGNIPRGLIKRLVQQVKSGRKLTKSVSSKAGLGRDASLFYGSPGSGWPEGIYRRIPGGLVPIVVFPRKPAKYKKRFDFYGFGVASAERRLNDALRSALAHVIGSAR